jgi:hypothetical protein
MSSTTSTKAKRNGRRAAGARPAATGERRPATGQPQTTVQQPAAPGAEPFRPVHLLVLGAVAASTTAVLVVHATRPANIVFIVLAVIVAAVTATALYRTLWPLASDAPLPEPDMMGGRTRAALEREKTIVLRAIKELEFDRAMGKVSAADCEEMVGRLRARAVRLIRQLDAGGEGYRDLIERELNARLESRVPQG